MPYHDDLATAYTVPLWKLEIHLDDIFFGKGNYDRIISKYIELFDKLFSNFCLFAMRNINKCVFVFN